MSTELYLIAPATAESDGFAPVLKRVLAAAEVSALLLPQGDRPIAAYRQFVAVIAPIAQAAGCAVLIEGDPALVQALDVDGLHVTGGGAALTAALKQLKPDHIVGVGGIDNRHDAMTVGELGLDYIMFGPLSGAIGSQTRELAGWWAEAMVVPSVLSDPQATAASADPAGCEFLALSESLWQAADPAQAIAAIAATLERKT